MTDILRMMYYYQMMERVDVVITMNLVIDSVRRAWVGIHVSRDGCHRRKLLTTVGHATVLSLIPCTARWPPSKTFMIKQ
jgi:hypothetical protein